MKGKNVQPQSAVKTTTVTITKNKAFDPKKYERPGLIED